MRTTPVLSGRDILTGTSIVVGKNTVTTLGRVILDTATRAFTAERVFTEVEWGFHEAALAVAVIVAKYGGAFLASRLRFWPWACWQTSLVT